MYLLRLLPLALLVSIASAAANDAPIVKAHIMPVSPGQILKRSSEALPNSRTDIAMPMVPKQPDLVKRANSCDIGYSPCYNGCCPNNTVCGTYGGEQGCCPIGVTCSRVGCGGKYPVNCGLYCCEPGTTCSPPNSCEAVTDITTSIFIEKTITLEFSTSFVFSSSETSSSSSMETYSTTESSTVACSTDVSSTMASSTEASSTVVSVTVMSVTGLSVTGLSVTGLGGTGIGTNMMTGNHHPTNSTHYSFTMKPTPLVSVVSGGGTMPTAAAMLGAGLGIVAGAMGYLAL